MAYFTIEIEQESRNKGLFDNFSFDFQVSEFMVAVEVFKIIAGKPQTSAAEFFLVDADVRLSLMDKRTLDAGAAAMRANMARGGVIKPS